MEEMDSYTRALQIEIALKDEIVLDFTSLKACLDPQREKPDGGDEFDYEDFVCQQLDKGNSFSSLQVLKVRNLKISQPLTPQKEDYYADFLHGTMQLSNLVELDLSGIILPQELQKHLTFWNIQNLKHLQLDSMGLTSFPSSVGRLRKLEVLSVRNNHLNDLPVTIVFCLSLKELNLTNNKFTHLPGILLRLKNIQELRRYDNPLLQLFHGFEQAPHIKISNPPQEKSVFNPDFLQSLCTKAAFINHIDYWTSHSVGPLQCKILDCLASQFSQCENCNTAVHKTGKNLTVDVMMIHYLDLRFVPVRFTVCSMECQAAVLQHYRELQTQTQADIDREYEETVKLAERQAKRSAVDISASVIGVPEQHFDARTMQWNSRTATASHKQRKCAIM